MIKISSHGLKILKSSNGVNFKFCRLCTNFAFVPKHNPCEIEVLNKLQNFIEKSNKIFVLTGAGISTESGIPDYRSEGVGVYATSTKRPVQMKVNLIFFL